jgi:hypothetical protein
MLAGPDTAYPTIGSGSTRRRAPMVGYTRGGILLYATQSLWQAALTHRLASRSLRDPSSCHHGLTDGGLGDVNPARSLREIQILGHGREVAQVTQFHLGEAPYRKQLSVKE